MAKTLGKYRPIAELGRGGMAVVYLAASQGPRGFSKLVVVKELKEDFTQDPEFGSMFVDEARLAARLNHPNIVQTYEVAEEEKRFFLVMEYLEGQSLSAVRARLAKLGALVRDDQVRVLCEVLDGLAYAHDLSDYGGTPLNVVHRDVSPHNIIITYAGDVKLVDFGIAKTADQSSHTRTGVIKGKLSYMAPEQAFGKKVDRRADLFSVGVILWEAITAKRMWKGMAEGAIAHRLSVGDIPKITDHVQEPPPLLRAVCERALAPRPEDRYPNAGAMRQDLENYLASLVRKPTSRELGRLVSEAFREERAKLTALVEDQMKLIRTVGVSAASVEIPAVQGPAISLTPSGPSQSGVAPVTASQPRDNVSSQHQRLALAPTMRPPDEPPYSIKWLVAGGVLIVLLGAAVTTVIMAPWSQPPSAPAGSSVDGSAGAAPQADP